MTLAIKILLVWILQPTNDHLLIAQLVDVLQIQQIHHQPGGFSGTALVGVIQGAETIIEHCSVDQGRKHNQFMVHVDLDFKAAAEKFSPVWNIGRMRFISILEIARK